MTREEREEAIRYLEICKKYIDKIRASEGVEVSKEVCMALDMAIKALEQEPCNDTVSRGVFEQVMWERDTAIEQLRELGYELGQKIEPCDDCVSRSAVMQIVEISRLHLDRKYDTEVMSEQIKALPSVIPKREENTVSEEVYTEEYIQRKKLEYELYVLKKKISELI